MRTNDGLWAIDLVSIAVCVVEGVRQDARVRGLKRARDGVGEDGGVLARRVAVATLCSTEVQLRPA